MPLSFAPRGLALGLGSLLILAAGACNWIVNPPAPLPNLTPGDKVYTPTTTKVGVTGFGINGALDVLPPGTGGIGAMIFVVNNGNAPVPAGYTITDVVSATHLVSTGTSVGFMPVPGPPLFTATVPGPALAAKETAAVGPIMVPIPKCGVYVETVTVDSADVVKESSESDNVRSYFFEVPGTMMVDLSVVENANSLWHATAAQIAAGASPGPPAGWLVSTGTGFATHTFTITPVAATAPPSTYYYNYYQKPIFGSLGSSMILSGPAPVQPPAPPVGAPVAISFQVDSLNTHNNTPSTDILELKLAKEEILGMVTAITSEGCFVTQKSAKVTIAHPAR